MVSSMATGERRWASARRGGMTVLGKVAVPKPINLPSQRLENHGLDPNVEIVPKSTLSWGSRPSSFGSNAWGSSVLSPKTEGRSGSPSQLSGRPSSGGGSRPSTAGSERTHESTGNVWASNSRPSSASGTLASNNTSLPALRPQSAETRCGSSQLSRFSEPSSEGSGVKGPNSAADKLVRSDLQGVGGSASDGFSLSSGDFPTLGLEKCSGKNVAILEHSSHGCTALSSGGPPSRTEKVDTTPSDGAFQSTDFKGRIYHTQTKDSSSHLEDGHRPGMDTWCGDPYPYPNSNIPPQAHPYEVWHGAPLNPQGGFWYRGPPGAPHPYGGPICPPPGGYPMEPFLYYRPLRPGLPNAKSGPPQVAGPHGPHCKSGDLCRPMVEPYMHPGMAVRPGFYPGYYRPPMGYCNPNERDFPFMGMPCQCHPSAHNRYPNQNTSEHRNSHARKGEARAPEECGPPSDSHGQYSMPVKNNNGWEKSNEEHVGRKVISNAYTRDRGHSMKFSALENVQHGDYRKDEPMNHGKRLLPSEEVNTASFEDKVVSSNPTVKFHGNVGNLECAHVKLIGEDITSARDHSLIQKIEGLNARAWASDLRQDTYNRMQVVNAKPMYSSNEANATVHLERHHPSGVLVTTSCDMNALVEGKSLDASVDTVTTIPRGSARVVQRSGDYNGKDGFNSQDLDGWHKRSAILESPSVVPQANSGKNTKIQVHDVHSMKMPRFDGEVKDNATLPIYDPCDSQRSKMREIAKQRAAQLQKEEEERMREQKAKALAKLEELNMRSGNQSKETSNRKLETAVSQSSGQVKVEESEIQTQRNVDGNQSGQTSSTLVFGSNVPLIIKTSEFNISSAVTCSEAPKTSYQDPVLIQNQPLLASTDDACIGDDTGPQSVPHVQEVSRQKRVGYKQKQRNFHSQKNPTEKQGLTNVKDNISAVVSASREVAPKAVSSASSELNALVELPTVVDSSFRPRKRSNMAAKNKGDEPVPREADHLNSVNETAEPIVSNSKLELADTLLPAVDKKDAQQSVDDNAPSLPLEDAHGRPSNSWKPQHQRNAPKISQGREAEKSQGNDAVVWAPVKPQNKIAATKENNQKPFESEIPSTKNDHVVVQSTSKSRRAEMERYVPKPLAKELMQQGNFQQSSSASVEQSISDGAASGGKSSSQGSERTGKPVEPHHMESGKPRQTKAHSSWRQCGSTEPVSVQCSEDSSSSMHPRKNGQTSAKPQQTVQPNEQPLKGLEQIWKDPPSKSDEQPVEGQRHKSNDDKAVDDGWNTVDEPIASFVPASCTGTKDHHAASGRGKKHPFRGHRGSGLFQTFNQKNRNVSESDTQGVPHSETRHEGNRPTSSKENHIAHWQPKSQAHMAIDEGNKRQTVTGEGERLSKRETSRYCEPNPPSHSSLDNGADSIHPHLVHSVSENKELGYQEFRREWKNAPPRGRQYSEIEENLAEVELGAVDNNDQRISSSGFWWNGNYNDRLDRGLDFQGDRSFTTHDNRQTYAPENRDRQRQRQRQNNSHYEYQPMGRQNNMKNLSNAVAQREDRRTGQRFRERGQGGHSRRGAGSNFYRRQRGNNNGQMDGVYEWTKND